MDVDLREDQALLVGGGGQQVRGVAAGVGGAADPFAVDREKRAGWWLVAVFARTVPLARGFGVRVGLLYWKGCGCKGGLVRA
ncbi:MAG: hypothetical protein QOH90_2155, partial [Actinomycetota bacterium]|nr:hypothetical protein [Actinomycetota bacterium]